MAATVIFSTGISVHYPDCNHMERDTRSGVVCFFTKQGGDFIAQVSTHNAIVQVGSNIHIDTETDETDEMKGERR